MLSIIILGTVITAVCGKTRIVGGQDAQISQYPYQVSFIIQNHSKSFLCGGTLISENWVLTAAHCFEDWTADERKMFKVRAGSTQIDRGGELLNVERVQVHPEFIYLTTQNDIALIRLVSSVTAGYAGLPLQNQEIPDGTMLTVTGWGRIHFENETKPTNLRVVQIPTINRKHCNDYYARIINVSDNMFCTGFPAMEYKGPCLGDSGGPAVKDGIVLGVVSWGTNRTCPAVYTQVSKYVNWIRGFIDK